MLYIIIALLIATFSALVWLFFDMKKKMDNKEDREKITTIIERLAVLSEQNNNLMQQNHDLRRTVDAKLSETHKTTQEQMGQTMRTVQGISGQSAKQIADVVAGLTELRETNKQVVNFSAQLQNLQDILKNPKQRGVLGEYFLESTLKNVLPPALYQMQYKLGKDENGKDLIVDAAIILGDKRIIPIDSKFSLENYNKILECVDKLERDKLEKIFKQDLKNRIDETSKYIQSKYNTMEFAFMFIPSEAIYYDLLINKVGDAGVNAMDLIEYANRKKVQIVSPNSFYAFLQTILLGLKQMQVQKSTQEIIKRVQNLGTHLEKYGVYMSKLGNNLGTTVGAYENARKEFQKIDKDVVKIGGVERELIETVDVEKPRAEE
ncbi:MAG TPA: DNA recombination protein RmuC [Candidatus Moranbacteria bacterium]|mgnify:CR=1 FL=1|nr:DNA recombination protein RmuC [Candidatus Moranbacteria bacterium]